MEGVTELPGEDITELELEGAGAGFEDFGGSTTVLDETVEETELNGRTMRVGGGVAPGFVGEPEEESFSIALELTGRLDEVLSSSPSSPSLSSQSSSSPSSSS